MTSRNFRDCAVFLTHQWTPAIAKHFARLKQEAAGVVDVFLVLHTEPGRAIPAGIEPDLTVSLSDAVRCFPARGSLLRQHASAGNWTTYVDTLWIAAFLHEKLAAYDRFWLVEYDVDLKGHWGRFFAAASDYEGDVLATRLRRIVGGPIWPHAKYLALPAAATDPVAGLFCISRLSRPVIAAYMEAVSGMDWQGHFEALIPTFASLAGFSVAEIGGRGEFTPPDRIDRHYAGGPHESSSVRTTYSFRPPHAFHYVAERTVRPSERDTLYHPVKKDVSLSMRLRYFEQDLRATLRPKR